MLSNQRYLWYVYLFWIITTGLLGVVIVLDVLTIIVLPQWFIKTAIIIILLRWLVVFLLWVFGKLT